VTLIKDPYWVKFLPEFLREKCKGKTNLHAIIHNSGWLMLDKVVRVLLTLLVGAWVARYLGPESFGELAYVLAYIAFFQAIANLGADGIVVRNIAQNKNSAPQVLGTTFILRLAVGLVCWLVALGCMAWTNGIYDRSVALVALAGGALIFQAADTIDLWFQSQSQSRRTVLAKLVSYLISNGIRVWLILVQAPLIAFAAVLALEALLAAVGLMVAYRSFKTTGRWLALANTAKALVKESWPYMISGVSIMIYMRIDQIMLKNMLGERELGIYAAMLPLSQVWHIIPMTIVASVAPYVAKIKSKSEDDYLRTLGHIFKLLSAIAIIGSITTAILAETAIRVLYGGHFIDSSRALSIHVFSNIFISLGVAQGLWQINENRPRISLYKTIIGAAVSILGNLLLIPKFEIVGAAAVAVMAQFISAFASNIFFAPHIFKMQLYSIFQINYSKRPSIL
jgi:O-antigen/teichoic acid export membrane protein